MLEMRVRRRGRPSEAASLDSCSTMRGWLREQQHTIAVSERQGKVWGIGGKRGGEGYVETYLCTYIFTPTATNQPKLPALRQTQSDKHSLACPHHQCSQLLPPIENLFNTDSGTAPQGGGHCPLHRVEVSCHSDSSPPCQDPAHRGIAPQGGGHCLSHRVAV